MKHKKERKTLAVIKKEKENVRRRMQAIKALESYRVADPYDLQTPIIDLLTDLKHLVWHHDVVDWRDLEESAQRHFEAEA